MLLSISHLDRSLLKQAAKITWLREKYIFLQYYYNYLFFCCTSMAMNLQPDVNIKVIQLLQN